jgi:hypothetical protein
VVTPPQAFYQQQQHQIFPHEPHDQQGLTTFRVMSGVMKTGAPDRLSKIDAILT